MQKLTEEQFAPVIKNVKDDSIESALVEESARYENIENGISIMSDCRHGHRRNANDSDTVLLGVESHKVVHSVHLTKAIDPIPQRHEAVATRQAYEHFNNNNIQIKTHVHDANASVNKIVEI